MSIEQYSIILAIAIIALSFGSLLSLVAYYLSANARVKIQSLDYFFFVKCIGFLAITSTLGALTYQYAYQTPVCELCWWQRIFMFPIDILVIIALIFRDRVIHIMTATLALIGGGIAVYHYSSHVQKFILKSTETLPSPCATTAFTESCANSPILTFGFVTIPFMAIMAFLGILTLSFYAYQAKRGKI